MCDKAFLEKGVTLKSVPDCYKNHEMCNKAVDNCPHALWFVPKCYITQKMCDKTVYTCPPTIKYVLQWCFFVIDSISDEYKSQDIFDRVVSLNPFLLVYFLDKYITQKIYSSIETY